MLHPAGRHLVRDMPTGLVKDPFRRGQHGADKPPQQERLKVRPAVMGLQLSTRTLHGQPSQQGRLAGAGVAAQQDPGHEQQSMFDPADGHVPVAGAHAQAQVRHWRRVQSGRAGEARAEQLHTVQNRNHLPPQVRSEVVGMASLRQRLQHIADRLENFCFSPENFDQRIRLEQGQSTSHLDQVGAAFPEGSSAQFGCVGRQENLARNTVPQSLLGNGTGRPRRGRSRTSRPLSMPRARTSRAPVDRGRPLVLGQGTELCIDEGQQPVSDPGLEVVEQQREFAAVAASDSSSGAHGYRSAGTTNRPGRAPGRSFHRS